MTGIKEGTLPIMHRREAVRQAMDKVRRAKEEEQAGLLCQWPKFNYLMGGGFRFGEVTYICGASGSGKSYLLNILRENFANRTLNQRYKRSYKILSFALEMSAADEIIRTFSSQLHTSYSVLMSSHEKLGEELFAGVRNTGERLQDDDIIHYVEHSGNRNEIEATIEKFNMAYPEDEIIVTIDHTLLMNYLDERSEVDLVNQLSRLAIRIRKQYGAMVILLGQLNDKIENDDRIDPVNRHLHYPRKQDIHGGKSVFMAADTVLVMHRPETLGLAYYGPNNFPTQGLVAIHKLKGRLTGGEGILLMTQDFAHGTLLERETTKTQTNGTTTSDGDF